MQNNVLMPGDKAGNYDKEWTKTFDLKFLILWIVLFAILLIVTIIFDPSLFSEKTFFAKTGIKLFIMMILALGWFKVNYTRKIQHFAAYLVPLLSPPTKPFGILPHLWESLFVLFMFLMLIGFSLLFAICAIF